LGGQPARAVAEPVAEFHQRGAGAGALALSKPRAPGRPRVVGFGPTRARRGPRRRPRRPTLSPDGTSALRTCADLTSGAPLPADGRVDTPERPPYTTALLGRPGGPEPVVLGPPGAPAVRPDAVDGRQP